MSPSVESNSSPQLPPPSDTPFPSTRTFQFGVADLLVLTFCLAIVAWLVSLEQWALVSIWVGTVFGWVIGKGSDYPTFLTSVCGSVLGLAIVVASVITIATQFGSIISGNGIIPITCCLAAWAVVLGIFLWLCFRVGRSRIKHKQNEPKQNELKQKSPLIQ